MRVIKTADMAHHGRSGDDIIERHARTEEIGAERNNRQENAAAATTSNKQSTAEKRKDR